MESLSIGEKVKIHLGGECEILEQLGAGGQGVVYRVSYENKEMALKWYTSDKIRSNMAFYKNIENNIGKGAPTEEFLWPIEITEIYKGSFGYLMNLCPKSYVSFEKFLLAKTKFASVLALCNAGLNIVSGFRELHSRGYGYQDLNDGNFFINPITGAVLICDNDNVAPYGENLGIAGKARYMAPEIVMRRKTPDVNTDKFSLAVVLFLLLFMNHPLEGNRTMKPCMTEELEYKFYGKEPVFMYDPTDDSNRPVKGIHVNAIMRWPIYPSYVREMFVKAFTKEAMLGKTPRVIEKAWQEMFIRLRDDLVICPHCGEETFVAAKKEIRCINCGKIIKTKYTFVTSNYAIPLVNNKLLFECHTDEKSDSGNFKTATAVVKYKTEGNKFGIKNLTNLNWIVEKPDGTQITVKPNAVFAIEEGTQIFIGNTKAIIK